MVYTSGLSTLDEVFKPVQKSGYVDRGPLGCIRQVKIADKDNHEIIPLSKHLSRLGVSNAVIVVKELCLQKSIYPGKTVSRNDELWGSCGYFFIPNQRKALR